MKYDILYADTINNLIIIVNRAISQFWKPQGGITCGKFGGFYQVMIKEKPEKPR